MIRALATASFVLGAATIVGVRVWHIFTRPDLTEAQLLTAAWPHFAVGAGLMLPFFMTGAGK